MAKNTETLTIKVDADTDQARRDLHALEEVANDIGGDNSKIKIDVDTDEAQRSIQDLLQDVDKLSSEDATIKLELAKTDLEGQIADISDRVADLNATKVEIDIAVAEGAQVMGDIQRIYEKLADLDAQKAEIQVELANGGQVIGDLEQVEGKVKEIDGQKAEVRVDVDTKPVEEGLGRAKSGTQELSDSARGANSALANMIGNSAQDLGNLSGIAGSAGVAIGQMAEYASDAALASEGLGSALSSMAAVALPIAALSVAVLGVTKVMEHFSDAKKRQEELEAAVRETTQAFIDGTGSVEEWNQAVSDAFNQGTATSGTLFSQFLFNKEDAENQTKILTDLGILNGTLNDYGEIINSLAKGESAWASELLQRQGMNEKDADLIGGAIALGTDYDDMLNHLSFAGQALTPTLAENIRLHEQEIRGLQELNDIAGDNVDSVNDSANAYLNAQAALGGLNEEFVIAARAKFPTQPVEAAKEFLRLTNEQNRATQEAADFNAGYNAMVERNKANIAANAAETERMTFTQEELNAALRDAQDPLQTLPGHWAVLIANMESGQAPLETEVQLINDLAEATGKEPGEIFNIIVAEAQKAKDEVLGVADAMGKLRDQRNEQAVDLVTGIQDAFKGDAATAIDNITKAFEGEVSAVADGIQAWRDHTIAVREAGIEIGKVVDEIPDIAGALSAEFDQVDDIFSGLKFDVDFQPSLTAALDDLNSFKPDLQTVADEWSSILAGQPIDIYGNVRADDSEFLEKVGNLRNLFQEGVVNAFQQGGVDAANTFVQSTAARIAASTGLDIAEVYRIMGLPPDGSITTLIQPEIDKQHADQARSILDSLTSVAPGDERIAKIHVALETGAISGDVAYIASLLLAQQLGIPVEPQLAEFTPAQRAEAQAQLDAGGAVTIPTATGAPDTSATESFFSGLWAKQPVTREVQLVTKSDTLGDVAKLIDAVANKRRTADIDVKADNAGAISSILDAVAEDRVATYFSVINEGSRANADKTIDNVARDRVANINVKADDAGRISSILDAIVHDRTVHLRVHIDNYNEVERQLDQLARPRTQTITTRLGGARTGAAVN